MTIGSSYNLWVLSIDRSGDAAHLVVADSFNLTDRYEYDGVIQAGVLTVPAKRISSAGYCGETGGRIEFTGQGSVAGRFSDDGRMLTAEETQSPQLTSGEVISMRIEWSASQFD